MYTIAPEGLLVGAALDWPFLPAAGIQSIVRNEWRLHLVVTIRGMANYC